MYQVYALKRLVRGLGSGHDAARQGFSLALAAALVRVPEVESLPALDMLEAALEVSKSTKVLACGPYSFCIHTETAHGMRCRPRLELCTDVVQRKLPAPASVPASARPAALWHASSLHRWLRDPTALAQMQSLHWHRGTP